MFTFNYRDARPIYEQVKDQIRHLMVTGAIASGEKLPSVRTLATSLAINPNTIQRAYEALERDGYLYSIVGRGSFAAEEKDPQGARRGALLAQMEGAVSELLFLGATVPELAARIEACAQQAAQRPALQPDQPPAQSPEGGEEA